VFSEHTVAKVSIMLSVAYVAFSLFSMATCIYLYLSTWKTYPSGNFSGLFFTGWSRSITNMLFASSNFANI